MNGQCDADASASELAKIVVYTRSGPLELCNHHANKHLDSMLARGYVIVLRSLSLEQMPRPDVVMGPGIPAAEMVRSFSY